MTRPIKKGRLPVHYPSVPDSESAPTQYNEPDLRKTSDRVPADRFKERDTRADLRLRLENLLQYKEAIPEKALTALGSDARSLLVEMLEEEALSADDTALHRLIAVAGQLSLKRAIAPLSAILTSRTSSSITRAYAASALGRIGDAAAIEALAVSAQSKDDMVRRQVAIALGRIDREAVVPHLLALRDDKSIAVGEVALSSLQRWQEKLGQKLGTGRNRTSKSKPSRGKKLVRKKSAAPEH